MNEQACAFVCAILSSLCVILFGYTMMSGDSSCVVLAMAFAFIIVLLSGLVLMCRHL